MIYRKRGCVARWEHGRLVVVREAGEAIEERGVFEVRPIAGEIDARLDDVARIAKPFRHPNVERLVVSHGVAEHECNGVRWREESRRLHIAMTHKQHRVLIDQAGFDYEEFLQIAGPFLRAGVERDAPPRIRLAPNVTAALLPHLVGVAPPNVRLMQSGGGLDGNGEEIQEFCVAPGATLPNVFRPSYRIRPVRMPLNLRLESDVDVIDRDMPVAVALLAPIAGLMLRVLVVEIHRAYPSTIRISRIDAVDRDRTWYPYGAGAFGSEIML
ncbi:MAG TPA: hypothetical protein VGR95_21005 [Thermoanaerobaculia bacterium]|jgi:hypothetical protein|nr:hypothetical protein [Thermoanaerobaculia bacterium]